MPAHPLARRSPDLSHVCWTILIVENCAPRVRPRGFFVGKIQVPECDETNNNRVDFLMYEQFVLARPNSTEEICRGVLGAVVREALWRSHRHYRIKSRPINFHETIWSIEISNFGDMQGDWGVGHTFISPSPMSVAQAEDVLLYRLGLEYRTLDDPPWRDLEIWLALDWDDL